MTTTEHTTIEFALLHPETGLSFETVDITYERDPFAALRARIKQLVPDATPRTHGHMMMWQAPPNTPDMPPNPTANAVIGMGYSSGWDMRGPCAVTMAESADGRVHTLTAGMHTQIEHFAAAPNRKPNWAPAQLVLPELVTSGHLKWTSQALLGGVPVEMYRHVISGRHILIDATGLLWSATLTFSDDGLHSQQITLEQAIASLLSGLA